MDISCTEGLRHADKTVRACALKVLGLTGHCAAPHLGAIAERLKDAEESVQTAALRDCFEELEAGSSSHLFFFFSPFIPLDLRGAQLSYRRDVYTSQTLVGCVPVHYVNER